MNDPLVKAAFWSLVRKGVLLLFSFFGFDRILSAGEHAALAEYVSGIVMILLGIGITWVWSYLSAQKLLCSEPPAKARCIPPTPTPTRPTTPRRKWWRKSKGRS